MLTYLFGALTNTTQFIATEEQLSVIVHWTFGTLNESKWDEVLLILATLAITLPFLFNYAWCYNALNQADRVKTLGGGDGGLGHHDLPRSHVVRRFGAGSPAEEAPGLRGSMWGA